MTDTSMTRRAFVGTAAALPVAGLFAGTAAAQAKLPKLEESDPVAKALMYVHDAKLSKAPNYKAGQTCANCIQVQGSGDWRPCNAFPGKLVAAQGWCSAWVAKPA